MLSIKRQYVIITMLGICINAFSQYRVVNTEQQQQSLNIVVEEYDSTYNFGVMAHNEKLPVIGKKEYYQRFIGQEIIFYKRCNSSVERPMFYSNFRTTTPYAVMDTIWKKRRPIPKPKDYKIVEVQTDYYKAEHTDAGWVVCCGETAFLFDGFKSSDEKAIYHAGFFTPSAAIEGKTFKILSIREGKYPNKEESYHKYLIFTLLDENGQRLLWYTKICDPNSLDHPVYPFIVKGYFEKMKERFLGKEMFYFGHYTDYGTEQRNIDKIRYKVKELIFAESNNSYSIPAFLVESYITKEQAIVALCKTPDLYRTNDYDFRQLHSGAKTFPKFYDDILSTMIVEEGSVYLKKLEKKGEWYKTLTNRYGLEFGDAIYRGEVRLGMTTEMVLKAIGEPTKINTTEGSYGVLQQWCYEYSKRYLYFKNGTLTDIQEY